MLLRWEMSMVLTRFCGRKKRSRSRVECTTDKKDYLRSKQMHAMHAIYACMRSCVRTYVQHRYHTMRTLPTLRTWYWSSS
jgi:hypothetical protein